MPRQQKYQNPQAAKEREKKKQREGGHRGKVLADNQFLKLKWMFPNNRGGKNSQTY